MPVVKADVLQSAIIEVFASLKVPRNAAALVAEHLVDAELCGVVSHGVIRVPQYVRAVEDGDVDPQARLRMTGDTTATARFDGGRGFGQVMARGAMDAAVERALRSGVAAVTLVNCGHTGRLGAYTEHAATRGCAAMMMVNAGGHGQWVAPFGGTAGRLSTNPLSLAVPSESGDPLVLDIATSVAPEGKIRSMMTNHCPIPEGWVVDHAGRSTTNPADLYGPPRGALLPVGDHKGFGLAMLIDALAGGLSGAGCCVDIDAPLAGKTDGVLIVAVSVEAFVPLSVFRQTVLQLAQHVKSSPPSAGIAEVCVPGEIEARTRRTRLREGIPIADETWASIEETANGLHIELPT